MTLETEASGQISNVTEHQLRQIFEDAEGIGEFVILSQGPETYIQAAGDGDGPYCLEYRDGGADRHFEASGDFTKKDVQKAFLWYLAGDPRWQTGFSWKNMLV